MDPTQGRVLTMLAAVVVVAAALARGSVTTALPLVAVVTAWTIVRRRPDSPVGPALAWCGGAIGLVTLVDALAADPVGDGAATWLPSLAAGLWPVNLAGLLVLLLVFPDGRLSGRLWASVPVLFAAANGAVLAGLWGQRQEGGRLVGEPAPWQLPVAALGLLGVGAAMLLGVASTVVRFRQGEETQRDQIKWLALAGGAVVAFLVGGWVAESLGMTLAVAYTPFLVATVVLVPLAVAVAVVRHDLLDIDRLLGESVAWALALVSSAAVYGIAAVAMGQLMHRLTAAGSSLSAFVAAVALLPVHQHVRRVVGQVLDRDRHVAVAAVEHFAADVRGGQRAPEEIEAVLRSAQGDPGLRLLLADGPAWVDLDGRPHEPDGGVVLESGGIAIARLVLSRDSARNRRRASELLRAAWVAVEVSRLRVGLRQSRARLAQAAAEERLRLERDLHDGIQQRLVATGMRLSLLQRHLAGEQAAELGTAVDELLDTVGELRRLAQGVRPSRLDDGLGAALESVAMASPVPIDLVVANPIPEVDDARAQAAFLTVSEAVANVLKHARASRIEVRVEHVEGRLRVRVTDDGVGGASGLITLRDRVESIGGALVVDSPPGVGTTLTAVM